MPPRSRPQGTDIAHPAIEGAGGIAPFLGAMLLPITRIVPDHIKPEAFIALVLAAVNRDPKLKRAALLNPESLVYAMRQCAILGHNPVRGQFVFTPFNNSKATGGVEIVGIEEYRGVIERMFRAGGVVSVHAEVVRKDDVFRRVRGALPIHEYDERADPIKRGHLDGVYAWAKMHTGDLSQVVWMNRSTVKKHRDVAKTDAFWGPWDEDPEKEAPWAEDMWLKTGLHGLERWVPTSAAYRWEVAKSEANAVNPETGFPPGVTARPVQQPGADNRADPERDIVDAVIIDPYGSQTDSRGHTDEPPWPETAAPGSGGPGNG